MDFNHASNFNNSRLVDIYPLGHIILTWANNNLLLLPMLHASLRTNKYPFEFPWFDLIENHIHNLQEIVLIIIQLSGQWISVHEHVYQFLNVFFSVRAFLLCNFYVLFFIHIIPKWILNIFTNTSSIFLSLISLTLHISLS